VDIPPWVRYHGAASPESLLRDWFPRASGVISLSRHAEGRPQVLLEAMASSLPVICSRIPAHEDLVTHGRTGMIVDTRDAFVESLRTLGATGTGRAMGQRTRQAMRADFGTWADCAARYRHHYDELLGATDACAS
jgi:glycosyltransferase involved in cell wall biosynthesis